MPCSFSIIMNPEIFCSNRSAARLFSMSTRALAQAWVSSRALSSIITSSAGVAVIYMRSLVATCGPLYLLGKPRRVVPPRKRARARRSGGRTGGNVVQESPSRTEAIRAWRFGAPGCWEGKEACQRLVAKTRCHRSHCRAMPWHRSDVTLASHSRLLCHRRPQWQRSPLARFRDDNRSSYDNNSWWREDR